MTNKVQNTQVSDDGYFAWAGKGLWNLAGGVKNITLCVAKNVVNPFGMTTFAIKEAITAIFTSKMIQQDSERIAKNKEEMKKLTGGEEWNEAIQASAENVFETVILPLINGGQTEELGFLAEAINNGKKDLVNTLASLIETVLRNLATQAPQSSSASSNEKIANVAEENNVIPNSDLQSDPKDVITKPHQFGASVVAQLLRVVKEIVNKDEYKKVREGKASPELKKRFFKEIASKILTSAFPNKDADKSIPWLLRQLLAGWGSSLTGLSWNMLVDIVAGQMETLLPAHVYIDSFDVRLNDDQEKLRGMILDPVFTVVKDLGKQNYDELPLTPLVDVDRKHCELYDATLKAVLSGDVLDKDKAIIQETFGHIEMLVSKLLARILVDIGGTEDPADGLAKLVSNVANKIKNELSTITPENQKEKLEQISKIILGDLLGEKGAVSNEDFQTLVKNGQLSENYSPSELKAKARLMKILPPQVSVSAIYDSTILPQINKIVGEVYETITKAQSAEANDLQKIKEVDGLDDVVPMILDQVNGFLNTATSSDAPLVPNNPILDGLVKKIFTSEDKTTADFVKSYVKIVVQRLLANLVRGKEGTANEILKAKIESILKEVVEGKLSAEDTIKHLLNDLLPDEELRALLPATFQSMDIKALILPAITDLAKPYISVLRGNIGHLKNFENQDHDILSKFKGLEVIRDYYADMVMGIVESTVEGDVMKTSEWHLKNPLQTFVNALAKSLLPSGSTKTETKGFVETHLKRVLNHTLAQLIYRQSGGTSQEKIGTLMTHVLDGAKVLTQRLQKASKEEFSEVTYENLFKAYKDALAAELSSINEEITKRDFLTAKPEDKLTDNDKKALTYLTPKDLNGRKALLEALLKKDSLPSVEQKKELWPTLLKLKAADDFLEACVPAQLLGEILPDFAVGMVRPQILFNIVNQSGVLTQDVYQLTLDTLKGLPKNLKIDELKGDVKSVRKAMNKIISNTIKKTINDKLGKGLTWVLFIVFLPLVVIGHALLMFAVDHLWLKQVDQFLEANKDFDKIMDKIDSKLPALLNAIFADKKDEESIKRAARAIIDELKGIFSTEWMRDLLAKFLVGALKPAKDEDGFFNWLTPYLIKKEEMDILQIKKLQVQGI